MRRRPDLQGEGPTDEAGRQRYRADLLDRFASVAVTCSSVDEFLPRLLELFVEVAHADCAVARLRRGDRVVARAAVGLDDEVTSAFETPLHLVTALVTGAEAVAGPLDSDHALASELIRTEGIRSLHAVVLRKGEEVNGLVLLGMMAANRALAQEQVHLLRILAARAGDAVAHYQAHEALEQAVLSRDQILGVVAHDLRNPIGVISITASSMHQRVTDSSQRRPIERIMRAAQRADHLIRDLLEISAIEGGRFSIEKRRVDTATTILAAIESQQSLAASASVILATDVSPSLPSIEADDERLLEVLENLVGNAVKFTNAGGTVTVGASRRADDILVWVKDTGPGIPPDHLPHLFDRFWQARKRDRRGTGLGLTICKAIVDAHGGRIWAESVEGSGTTMFFTLPAAASKISGLENPVVSSVLLVDDRPENLLSLRAILERPEYRLVTAQSGEEALRLSLRESFSVALIDIAMPGMDGLEVARHMKELERSRDVPIIFITAFGEDPDEIHRAYAAGGADYLVKPLDAEIVRKKVAVFVELSRRRTDRERALQEG